MSQAESVWGLVASFDEAGKLVAAAHVLREAGYQRLDGHTPFPVAGLDEALGHRRGTWVPLIVLLGALASGAFGYWIQWWTAAVDFPINVGGRPFHSWPAFIPVTFDRARRHPGRGGVRARAESAAAVVSPGIQRAGIRPGHTRPLRAGRRSSGSVLRCGRDPQVARADRRVVGTRGAAVMRSDSGCRSELQFAIWRSLRQRIANWSSLLQGRIANGSWAGSLRLLHPEAIPALRVALLLLILLPLASCEQRMADQPKYEVFEPGVAVFEPPARRPVEGTIARGTPLQSIPDTIPLVVDRALLERGQERYRIYCEPCHSPLGDGRGMIVERGFPAPPSYHIPRLRAAPDRHFYDVMTYGYGIMYSYAARVAPRDRWAIVAYIRALQLSQHAPADWLPPGIGAAKP